MKKKKYLPLYKEWMERGSLPKGGLCCCFEYDDRAYNLLMIFHPTEEECSEYGHGIGWWGRVRYVEGITEFTDTRQNIVLLMAAMNGEL